MRFRCGFTIMNRTPKIIEKIAFECTLSGGKNIYKKIITLQKKKNVNLAMWILERHILIAIFLDLCIKSLGHDTQTLPVA